MAAKKKSVAQARLTTRAGKKGSEPRASTSSTGTSPARSAQPSGKAKLAGKAKPEVKPAGKAKPEVKPAGKAKPNGKPLAKAPSAARTGTQAAASSAASRVVKKVASPGPKAPATKAAAVKAPLPSKTLGPGDRAPSFELPDQSGSPVSSAELAGNPYVLYFYPKDDTPGCTTQACGFRDASAEFEGVGVRVIGVSPDSVSSHQKFVAKYGLPFTLLSDSRQELAAAYGVWSLKKNYGREYMGIVRSTFLIDREGVVRKAWRAVRVNGHVSEVGVAAAELA